MSLPEVVQTVQDFGLGQVAPSTAKTHAKIGVCSGAAANTVQSWSGPNLKTMITALGSGPLAEAAAYHRQNASSPLYTCAATATAGVAGAVTHTGTGSSVMTVTGTPLDSYEVEATVTVAGASLTAATAKFTYSLDGGNTISPVISVPSSGSYAISGTGLTLVFAAGTFVVDDLYSFSCTAPFAAVDSVSAALTALAADPRTWGWVHIVNAIRPVASAVTEHPAAVEDPPNVTLTGTPVAWIDAVVKITTSGALTVGTFQYSLDNGSTYNGTDITLAATYALGTTGLTLNFTSASYTLNQQYTFNTYSPIATLFAAVDAKMTEFSTAFRYAGAVIELPDASDAILLKATASLASAEGRVMVAGGFCDLASAKPVAGGSVYKRTAAWPLAARLAKNAIHEDLGKVANGPLPGVVSLYRDENTTPVLGAARIAALRTITGISGFYAASDRVGDMLSAQGSDFNLSQRRTIMDVALTTNRAALLPYLNSEMDAKKDGTIRDVTASAIEAKVNGALRNALISGNGGKHVSSVTSRIDRTEVIITTNNLTTDVSIIPFGYAKSINVTVHYTSAE